LAEIALPVGGGISTQPMETIADKLRHIQQAVTDLGCNLPDIRITLSVLPSPAIPFLRICEQGLVNLRDKHFVDLIVG
jgi:adenine deaminase